jgi:hypothetical protein
MHERAILALADRVRAPDGRDRGAVMGHPLRTTALVVAAVALLAGCSWSQVFRLSLTVVDKADGTPIPGAQVVVDTSVTNEERKSDPVPPDAGLQADGAGRLEHDFSISGYTPTSSGGDRWYLKVSKEGYEPVVTDIKPNPPPDRREGKIPLAVRVEMRPVGNPPR